MVKILSAYSEDKPKVKLICEEKTLTQQQFKDECDINQIVERYLKTGLWSGASLVVPTSHPMYGNFVNIPDFREAMNQIVEARENFESLPPNVRKRFQNDPIELIEFIGKPENVDEAIKMGLMKPKPVVVPEVVPDANTKPA